MPKFVEYEPKSESEQNETKLIEVLKNCESIKLQSVAKIISDEAINFDTTVAYEMLQDSFKLMHADEEMAATVFSRWLTMKAEQPSVEVSLPKDQFVSLMDKLFPCLNAEFQTRAISVYITAFNQVEEVLNKVSLQGEHNLLEACVTQSAQLYGSRMNSDIVKLAEQLVKLQQAFSETEKYRDSISAITTFVLRTKEFTKADELIEATGLPCDPSVCLTYIREYLHKECTKARVDTCLDKYSQLRCGRSDEQTHYVLVRSMSKVGMVEESIGLLREITEEFFNFDQTIFNVVLDGCSKFNKIAEMQEILNLMDSCGFPLTVVGYNTIIDGLVRSGNLGKAWDVLDSMVKFNILPDHFTISTLCRGIQKKESKKFFDRIITLFNEQREKLEFRTTVMFNCMLECCVVMRDMKTALQVFEQFKQENNVNEQPDLVTYNILLKGFSQTKDLSSALKLVEEMKQQRLQPCKQTQNTLVDLSVNLNKFELSTTLFNEMRSRGLVADQQTYSTMIKGMKKQTRQIPMQEAYTLIFGWLDDLHTQQLTVDCVLQNCIMDVCIMYKDIPKTLEVYELLLKNNIEPNQVTFGLLIKAYGNQGNVKKCMEIFDVQMVQRKVEVNEQTQGALMEACVKNKDIMTGKNVYERMMTDKRIKMNTILQSTVLKMLNLDRRLKQSKMVQKTMCESQETQPNNFSYNTLIDTANKCGDLEFAEEIFAKMAQDGYQHDLISQGSMVKGFIKAKKFKNIVNQVRMIRDEGLRLDSMFIKTIFCNNNDDINAVYDDLKRNGMQVTESLIQRLDKVQQKNF